MVILEVLETWMTYINPIQGNKRNSSAYTRFNYPRDYKEIIHITKFERDTFIDKDSTTSDYKTNLTSYEFVNIWPTNMTSMRVAYGDPNVLQCNVQFAYDRFFTRFNYEDPNSAVLTNPSPNTAKDVVNRTPGGQGGLPLGTTTSRQGGRY